MLDFEHAHLDCCRLSDLWQRFAFFDAGGVWIAIPPTKLRWCYDAQLVANTRTRPPYFSHPSHPQLNGTIYSNNKHNSTWHLAHLHEYVEQKSKILAQQKDDLSSIRQQSTQQHQLHWCKKLNCLFNFVFRELAVTIAHNGDVCAANYWFMWRKSTRDAVYMCAAYYPFGQSVDLNN